jgi:hypothetical protein
MKEYKYPDSANITTDKENTLVIGNLYDYKEGGIVGECQFVADESDAEYYKWRFKWTIHPFTDTSNGEEFVCSEYRKEKYYYSGMWHILPHGSYIFPRRASNITDHLKKIGEQPFK